MMEDLFESAKALIDRACTQIVSFDLFDTLLVRPLLSRHHVISLLSHSIRSEYQLDVEAARISAEKALNPSWPTTAMLWHSAADQLGFPHSLAELFAEKEFELEKRLLFPRKLCRRIYDYAVSKGKRIIVVSDMHFSSLQLNVLLCKWGFQHVSHVYVSCEQHAVKRDGTLFDVVLAKEGPILPQEILHIGDSSKADVLAPRSKGICALHLPKDRHILSASYPVETFLPHARRDLYTDILFGFAFSHLSQYTPTSTDRKPLSSYTHLVVWPMLMHVVLRLLTSPDIQKSGVYQILFFASRDGYLTKIAYDILSASFSDPLPSHYLLISRAACHILLEDHYEDGLAADFIPDGCLLRDYIVSTVSDTALQQQILSSLSEHELSMPVKGNVRTCRSILSKFEDCLAAHHRERKKAACTYYTSVFGQSPSVLIVDCGFSGTICRYLTMGFYGAKRFDKVFFWETEKNKKLDSLNGTVTYTGFSEKKGHALAATVESLFSEAAASCTGFSFDSSGGVVPVFEDPWQPGQMVADIQFVQELAVELVRQFHECYGPLLRLLVPRPLPAVMDLAYYFSAQETLSTAAMFDGILFKEPYMSHFEPISLGQLILRRTAKERSLKK